MNLYVSTLFTYCEKHGLPITVSIWVFLNESVFDGCDVKFSNSNIVTVTYLFGYALRIR
jgi:hypothetical protein